MPESSGSSTQLSLVHTVNGRSVVHPLPEGPTSLGSGVDNDLVLEGDGVQPHHVVLELENEQLALRDLYAGETTINDEARTSGTLRAGDVLGLGTLRLRVLRVATTSRRVLRPDPKEDTTKRTSRRNTRSRRPSGSGSTTSSGRRSSITTSGRRSNDTSGARRREDPKTSGRRRREDAGLAGSGVRRRSARTTKDWLGELNGEPEEAPSAVTKRATPGKGATELEGRIKQLTARLRKAETRARSAQERLKHLELELQQRPKQGASPQTSFDLASLHDLCTSMVDEDEIEPLLESITDAVLHTFGADRAVSILTEEDGRNPLMNVERVRGKPPGGSPETGVAPEILERTLHTRSVLEVNADGGAGGLAAPILRGGRTFGILYFERSEHGSPPISAADLQLMSVFATLACLVIQPLMSEELT